MSGAMVGWGADLWGTGPISEGNMMKKSAVLFVWAAACVPLLAGGACAQQPAAAPSSGGGFADADALLGALERADEGMVTLTANIVYDKTFEVQGDPQTHKGKLYFVNKEQSEPGMPPAKSGGRKFAIEFTELWIGDVVRKDQEVYVFDGQWLVDKNFKQKQFIKKQVVPPGEKFDPLRVGEGPFPIPLGQKRADIQKRYVTALLPADDGLKAAEDASEAERRQMEKRKTHTAGAWQVKLDPRPEFVRDSDFKEIRLWYKRDGEGNLLPVMSRTIDKEGNVSVVALTEVQVQMEGKPRNQAAAVPKAVIDTDPPRDGWNVDIQEFRRHKEE